MNEANADEEKVIFDSSSYYFVITGRPRKKFLSEFSIGCIRNNLLGHHGPFWPCWTTLSYFGPYWAVWAILSRLGHSGPFFLLFRPRVAQTAKSGPNGPEWLKRPRVAQRGPNGPKWPRVAQNGPNGPEWPKQPRVAQSGPNVPEWPKQPRMTQSGPNGPQ